MNNNENMLAKGLSASGGKIYIGADHAGFELKEKIIPFLKGLNYEVVDKGAYKFNQEDDYPDFVREVALAVANDFERSRGIVLGSSGQGEAIMANRFKGVRAVVYYGGNEEIIKLSREHNDANILSLGVRFMNEDEAKKAVKIWLETPFSNEKRHIRRINKIDSL